MKSSKDRVKDQKSEEGKPSGLSASHDKTDSLINIEQLRMYQNHRRFSNKFYIIIALFILIAAAAFGFFVKTDSLMNNPNQIIQLSGEPDDLTYQLIHSSDSQMYTYEYIISSQQLQKISLEKELDLSNENFKLLFYRLASESIYVHWNGELIGSIGNLINDRINLWDSVSIINIPRSVIEEQNTLKLEIQASYQLGGIKNPVYLTNAAYASKLETWFTMMLTGIPYIAIGILAFSFILFIFLSSVIPGLFRKEYLYYAIASLCMMFNLIDYIPFTYAPLPLYVVKKITVSALYLTFAFVEAGICEQFKVPKKRYLWFVFLITAIAISFWFFQNFYYLKTYYSRMNIMLFAAGISWAWISIKNFHSHEYAKVLTIASISMLIFAGIEIYHTIIAKTPLLSFTISGTLLFILGLSFHVIFDYLDVLKRLSLESKRADFHYHKSIRDGLTGLYNHNFIMTAVQNIDSPFSILMIDIDKFKEVNDKSGHKKGDLILKLLAKTFSNCVRTDDLTGRYGGDEFMIILPNCHESSAFRVAEKIMACTEKLRSSHTEFPDWLTSSIGIYTSVEPSEYREHAVKKADLALYEAKKRGRNCIVSYLRWQKETDSSQN